MSARMESDSIGTLKIDADAYYGVQTERARQNFPITGRPLHPRFIHSLVQVKKAACAANLAAGSLPAHKASAILAACDEILAGGLRGAFVVDAIQGGAGASANMNANEVIANRAIELLGGTKGDYSLIHPNDDVNMAQSTNDVIPTAGRITALDLLAPLLHELGRLRAELGKKSQEFAGVLKMGRTQLQDAVPMRLGQSFRACASMLGRDTGRLQRARAGLWPVNLSGTAIGTCINTTEGYRQGVVPILAKLTGLPLRKADNLIDATQNLDCFVALSGALKTCALDLSKMCNDLRLLSSGPTAGLGEINLPPCQNGSSIMPGKINPVIPEAVNQVAFAVMGNDLTIMQAAGAGQLELNAFEPVLFDRLFDSLDSLRAAISILTDRCIRGVTANPRHCRAQVDRSAGFATALCPALGYRRSAEVAKYALRTGSTIREAVLAQGLLPPEQLDALLTPALLCR